MLNLPVLVQLDMVYRGVYHFSCALEKHVSISRLKSVFLLQIDDWLVVSTTPLKNMKVRLDRHPNFWGK